MDSSEKLALEYMRSRGFSDIRYEPDGNIPPDFLCDNRVAVEVRRLNQSHDQGGERKGLEETEIPLLRNIRDLFGTLGPPTLGQSWYVFYRFGRPLPKWKLLKPLIENEFRNFIRAEVHEPISKLRVTENFELDIFKSPTLRESFFVLGGYSDEQSGGFVVSEIVENLQQYILEKSRKIAGVRSKYPEWWLVLPDYIGHGLDEFDQSIFRDQTSIDRGSFDKVILVNPRDSSNGFEI